MIHVTSASTNGINSTLLWISSAYWLKAQSPLAHHSRSCKGYSHVWSTWVLTAPNCPSWKSWIIQQPQAAGAPEPPVVACILQKISHRNGAVNPIRHLDTRWHKTTAGVVNEGFFLTSWAGFTFGRTTVPLCLVSNHHPKSLAPIQVIWPCNHHLSSHRRSSHSLKDDPNIFDQNIWKRNHMTANWPLDVKIQKKLWSWRFSDLLLFCALLQQRRYMFSYMLCHIPLISLQTSGFMRWWDGSETWPRDRNMYVPFKYKNIIL